MLFKKHLAASLIAMAALMVPAVASAQISDQTLGEHVASTVHKYLKLTMFDDVTITVKDRNVVLTGRVTQPLKKDELGQRVAKIDGVRTFTNNIEVLPSSIVDQQLRQRLALSIYGNPAFQRYADMREPPIHIIVQDSHVTLVGIVNDEGEKALAGALARINGVMDVRNELRIEK